MTATGISDNKLSVLKITDKFRRRFDHRYRIGHLMIDESTAARLFAKSASEKPAELPTEKGSKADETVESDVDIRTQSGPDTTISGLPQHLLLETFQCLDAADQSNARQVDRNWNTLLTLPTITQVLHLPGMHHGGDIVPAGCLHRCWTSQTKTVVYQNSDELLCDPYCTTSLHRKPLLISAHLLGLIQRENRLARLNTLVLCDVSWSKPMASYGELDSFGTFICWIREELAILAALCDTLILKNVGLRHVRFETDHVSADSAFVHITSGRVTKVHCITVESLWRMMDDCLPCLSDSDFVRLSDWIKDRIHSSMPLRLLNILKERQSDDPREEVNFRGMQWTNNDLDNLDLRKLTKVTVHSLLTTCSYELLHLKLAW